MIQASRPVAQTWCLIANAATYSESKWPTWCNAKAEVEVYDTVGPDADEEAEWRDEGANDGDGTAAILVGQGARNGTWKQWIKYLVRRWTTQDPGFNLLLEL